MLLKGKFMNRMMIDLETLSTKTNGVILSCGAVVFNENIINEQYWILNQYEQIAKGRVVDLSTLEWWGKQDKRAYDDAFSSYDSTFMNNFAIEITELYKQHDCKEIWCQGADFDIPMVESLFETIKYPIFFKYSAKRDSRTVRKLYRGKEPELKGVAHNALDDARHQANCVIQILGEWGVL
jgi:hypothetical protein